MTANFNITKDNLDKLDAAIASGVRSVSFGDKSITFHSVDEMIKLRSQIARALGLTEPKRRYYPQVSKGF
jgi:hypothetical protein